MEVTTDYDIHDRVFIIDGNIKEAVVEKIDVKFKVNREAHVIYYVQKGSSSVIQSYNSDLVFRTRFEAACNWLEKQGLEPNDVIQSVFAKHKGKEHENE